jgi:hypothetical protein
MIRFLADENLNGKIVRGLKRERPEIDLVRVQDTDVFQADDPAVLEWAAQEERILLTHDFETMIGYASDRLVAGLHMPGVIAIRDSLPVGQTIADLLTIDGASEMSDWENLISFLPL